VRDISGVPAGLPSKDRAEEYTVWYGTNRTHKDPSDPSKGYLARRDTVVHYGSCRVFIPESHIIGGPIRSSLLKRLKRLWTGDRWRLRSVQELAANSYWSSLAKHLDMVDPSERYAVIFIHGYNVTFEQAALRAAQFGVDLSIRSAMAFFSWP
jgi:esterase/lipase superfamily enzyme